VRLRRRARFCRRSARLARQAPIADFGYADFSELNPADLSGTFVANWNNRPGELPSRWVIYSRRIGPQVVGKVFWLENLN
jgi:hypothetical protein